MLSGDFAMQFIDLHQSRRTIPRVQLHSEAFGLDGRICSRQLPGFLQRFHCKNIDASDLSIIQKRTGNDRFALFSQSADII